MFLDMFKDNESSDHNLVWVLHVKYDDMFALGGALGYVELLLYFLNLLKYSSLQASFFVCHNDPWCLYIAGDYSIPRMSWRKGPSFEAGRLCSASSHAGMQLCFVLFIVYLNFNFCDSFLTSLLVFCVYVEKVHMNFEIEIGITHPP